MKVEKVFYKLFYDCFDYKIMIKNRTLIKRHLINSFYMKFLKWNTKALLILLISVEGKEILTLFYKNAGCEIISLSKDTTKFSSK